MTASDGSATTTGGAVRTTDKPKAPLGKRIAIAGIVVGTCIGLSYGVSKLITPSTQPEADMPAELLSELVESGKRPVLVGALAPHGDGQVRATLATYYEDARRDEVFQRAFATRMRLDDDAYTVLLLKLSYDLPDAQEDDEDDEAENGDTDNAESEGAPTLEPLPIGNELVTLDFAGGESRESIPLRSLVSRPEGQAALLYAAYAGTGEVAPGEGARRFVVFPGAVKLDEVRAARLTLSDGRTLELEPRTERFPVAPGLVATDSSR